MKRAKNLQFIQLFVGALIISVLLLGTGLKISVSAAVAVDNKQEFDRFFEDQKEEFVALRKQLDTLREQEEAESFNAIAETKISLYDLMIKVMEDKRMLYQTRLEALRRQYDDLKHNEAMLNTVNTLHGQVTRLNQLIDRMSGCINGFKQRRANIITQQIKRNTVVITPEEFIQYKEDILAEMKPLLAKERNLREAGASPDELAAVKQNIDILCRELDRVNAQLEISQDVCAEELESLRAEVNAAIDKESLDRKFATDRYAYRKSERFTKKGIDLRIASQKETATKYRSIDTNKKYDLRTDAVKTQHQKAGKKFVTEEE